MERIKRHEGYQFNLGQYKNGSAFSNMCQRNDKLEYKKFLWYFFFQSGPGVSLWNESMISNTVLVTFVWTRK